MIDEVAGDELRRLLRDERRGVVIDFWSPWCAPCRVLRPHLGKLAEERRRDWRFVAVNAEAHPAVAEAFEVSSLPTLVWFRQGQEVDRLCSGVTVSSVAAKLDELTRG